MLYLIDYENSCCSVLRWKQDRSGLCSFRGDLAARPRWAGRTLSWALDMANFENVPVQLTGIEMKESTMLWSVFISGVGQNIKVCPASQHVSSYAALAILAPFYMHFGLCVLPL